jgi:hypothetical protein
MDNIIKLKDFVPFFQTISWIFFISIILIFFRKPIKILIENLLDRIKKGSSFRAGPIEIGEELTSLQSADKMQNSVKVGANGVEREKHRIKIYKANKGLFLTHILVPSKTDGSRYDIYIYLIRHKSKDFSDIAYVEFFFGHMWENKIFKIENKNKTIGIITSAYAPFLCTCCIMFKDGTENELYRYIDFEMK